MWAYDWDMAHTPARKINRTLIGYEQPVLPATEQAAIEAEAICGRTAER